MTIEDSFDYVGSSLTKDEKERLHQEDLQKAGEISFKHYRFPFTSARRGF